MGPLAIFAIVAVVVVISVALLGFALVVLVGIRARDTAAGFLRSARTRLCMSWCGEVAGTATISYSPVSLAMGVTCAIDTGD